jgi:hypothetical protein
MLLAFHAHDDEPTWAPLERLRSLVASAPHVAAPEVENFLYMGRVESDDGTVTIYLYKHVRTRRYLNVDETCRAYRYAGAGDDDLISSWYEPIDDLAEAIDVAQAPDAAQAPDDAPAEGDGPRP